MIHELWDRSLTTWGLASGRPKKVGGSGLRYDGGQAQNELTINESRGRSLVGRSDLRGK